MKKVLLFPGAFNPPHNGHIEIVKLALGKESFEELWVIPSGKRTDKTISISYNHRRSLGNIFVEALREVVNVPVYLISEELDDREGRDTYEVLEDIKSQTGIAFTQLIGSDGILSLYKNNRAILETERFIVNQRSEHELPIDFLRNKQVVFSGASLNISSTQIRDMVKNKNKDFEKLVPKKIALYIQQYDLYL